MDITIVLPFPQTNPWWLPNKYLALCCIFTTKHYSVFSYRIPHKIETQMFLEDKNWPSRTAYGQQVYEKIFNITSHQGNANKKPQCDTHLSEWPSSNNKCWWGYEEKWILIHSWWECKLVTATVENSTEGSQNTKKELLYDPAILLLGTYLGR